EALHPTDSPYPLLRWLQAERAPRRGEPILQIDWSINRPVPGRRMEMRAAAVQLNSTAEKPRNLEVAERLVRGAAAAGAELVVLPEKWNVLGDSAALIAGSEPLDGPTLAAARSWASELGIHLVAGSIAERVADEADAYNTSALIGPDGELE